MLLKTYYYEIERRKGKEVPGMSFRVTSLYFWESIPQMIEKDLQFIENKFNCEAYLKNIKRI